MAVTVDKSRRINNGEKRWFPSEKGKEMVKKSGGINVCVDSQAMADFVCASLEKKQIM